MLRFIQFDTDEGRAHELRLTREFFNNTNPVLRAVIMENALYWFNRGSYATTVTCGNRTKKENNAIVGSYEFSGHLTGHADDLRTRDMNPDFRNQYMARLDIHFSPLGLYILFHRDHLHVGIKRAFQKGNWAI